MSLKSSIYMLICHSTGQKYIGSTDLPIELRFRIHKSHYKRYLNHKASYISSVEVFKENNAHLILLEEVDLTLNDLSEREAFYIQSFNCIIKTSLVSICIVKTTSSIIEITTKKTKRT